MNIATASPALVLIYVWVLLCILMNVRLREMAGKQRLLFFVLLAAVAGGNHILRMIVGSEVYSKLLILVMHLPTFLVFRHLTKCSAIKMIFMIFSAVIFAAPVILIGNTVRWILFKGSAEALLISNLIAYGIMLVLAQVVFRKGFNYLLKYGDNRSFLLFSLVPLLYYIYLFCALNLDFSALYSVPGFVVRIMPTAEVFMFYILLLHSYKNLSEKMELEMAKTALLQKLDVAEEQIVLLNEAQTQTAVYQHDMRHHMMMLKSFLDTEKYEQAEAYICKVQADLEAITPKRFCENETVNLLCTSFVKKAERMDVRLQVKVDLPQELSVSDTELCSVVSNGLENALNAAAAVEASRRWVEFSCSIKQNKLLLEIQNPYDGEVILQDGLPVSAREGHGYGCQSIRTITERHRGLCSFEPGDGLFVLRAVLPVRKK